MADSPPGFMPTSASLEAFDVLDRRRSERGAAPGARGACGNVACAGRTRARAPAAASPGSWPGASGGRFRRLHPLDLEEVDDALSRASGLRLSSAERDPLVRGLHRRSGGNWRLLLRLFRRCAEESPANYKPRLEPGTLSRAFLDLGLGGGSGLKDRPRATAGLEPVRRDDRRREVTEMD